MTKDEFAKKSISLAFDFLRYLVDHPAMIEKLPDECHLEFLETDFPLIVIDSNREVDDVKKLFLKVKRTFDVVESEMDNVLQED